MGFLPAGAIAARRRAEVNELTATLRTDEAPPLRGVAQVGAALVRARKHDVLPGEQLRSVADSVEATGRVSAWFERRTESLALVAQHAQRLVPHPALAREIRRCFDPSGELADHASPELGRLRRRVAALRTDIQRRIDRILKAPRFEGILQDDYVTIRDERYVVPVRSGERGDFPGIVHGQSGSGATMFIEPEELIGPNNELRIAQLDVENEERRILTELSGRVRQHADDLESNADILTYLDLTCAAARLAVDLDMSLPDVTSARGGRFELRRARHPVLALRALAGELEVVPNDIVFDATAHVLVVSGPNTGGKTVTLKTVGLFSLMLRAGLLVPCALDAAIPEFERIFSDIGDEQAVEHDLSTFSGHVRNIARFLPECDAASMVLLDELFAGTDPEQGAALGRALLDELASRGCWVLVTTHLEQLKTLAFQDDRYACASMGFDVDRLEPTYRLRPGVPGSSYALRIARRLGLSPTVVERAADLVGETTSAAR
ncbi:MAG: endonuclease MutS2, partial [Myxococcales bacterium]|nr:endonuclease MutS2 [Myxococcales bacterium]